MYRTREERQGGRVELGLRIPSDNPRLLASASDSGRGYARIVAIREWGMPRWLRISVLIARERRLPERAHYGQARTSAGFPIEQPSRIGLLDHAVLRRKGRPRPRLDGGTAATIPLDASVSSSTFRPMTEENEHLVPAGGGRLVDLGGTSVHLKVPGERTGGAFALLEQPVDAGVIVEPHIHQHEDELAYVLEGTVWMRVGDHEVEATAGSYVWKPRGTLHTFWNPGTEPARILEIISPAGFEGFFAELADLIAGAPTDEQVGALCERYGVIFDHSWLPDLQDRFGPLRLV